MNDKKAEAAKNAGGQAYKDHKMNTCPEQYAGYEEYFHKGYEEEYIKDLPQNSGDDLSFISEANSNIGQPPG